MKLHIKSKFKYFIIFLILVIFFSIGKMVLKKINFRIYTNMISLKIKYKQTNRIFTKHCETCHREQSVAFYNKEWLFGNSYQEIYASINNGHPKLGMPPFETILSKNDIKNLTTFIINYNEQESNNEFLLKENTIPFIIHSKNQKFKLDTIVSSMDILIPWGLAFLPNNEILITSRAGSLYLFNKNQKLTLVPGTPKVFKNIQGGLLDVVLHPDFNNNRIIYLSYTKGEEKSSGVAVMRAKFMDGKLTEQKEIFNATPFLDNEGEYGSRLLFGEDKKLYISIGDRSEGNVAQDLNNYLGKIHRINDDGSIPKDNPFINTTGSIPSIFAYGLRNPQGLALNPISHTIWSGEHGPRGGDEINLIQSAKNYGWPIVTHGLNYDGTIISKYTENKNYISPIKYWTPSIAPSGMDFVTGDIYPEWKGDLFVSSLKYKLIVRLKIENENVILEEDLLKGIGRIRNIRMGPDGYLYFTKEGLKDYKVRKGKPGILFRITPV